MLKAPAGATIDAMMKATGWQQHSVRGFLAGPPKNRIVRFSGYTGTDVRVAQEARLRASLGLIEGGSHA
jgi:hypothetical protein